MANTIHVKAEKIGGKYTRQVILSEFDERHPNGEALVYAAEGKTFEVGDTARVRQLIDSGRLVKVSGPATGAAAKSDTTDTDTTDTDANQTDANQTDANQTDDTDEPAAGSRRGRK